MRHISVAPRCPEAMFSLGVGVVSMLVLLGCVFAPFSPLHTPASVVGDRPQVVSAGATSMKLSAERAWMFDRGFQRLILVAGFALPMIGGLSAGLLGLRAMVKIERAEGELSGDGPAVFGLLTGMFSLVVGLVVLGAVAYHQS